MLKARPKKTIAALLSIKGVIMSYIKTIIEKDMSQDIYDAELILSDYAGFEYNSIRLFDQDNNEVDLKDLKLVIYREV